MILVSEILLRKNMVNEFLKLLAASQQRVGRHR